MRLPIGSALIVVISTTLYVVWGGQEGAPRAEARMVQLWGYLGAIALLRPCLIAPAAIVAITGTFTSQIYNAWAWTLTWVAMQSIGVAAMAMEWWQLTGRQWLLHGRQAKRWQPMSVLSVLMGSFITIGIVLAVVGRWYRDVTYLDPWEVARPAGVTDYVAALAQIEYTQTILAGVVIAFCTCWRWVEDARA